MKALGIGIGIVALLWAVAEFRKSLTEVAPFGGLSTGGPISGSGAIYCYCELNGKSPS